MPKVNAQYNVASPDSLPVRLAAKMRRRMFELFLREFSPNEGQTILDVGATSDDTYEASNYLEAWYPHKQDLTAVGIDDAAFLEARYPGLRFVRADGRDLPFEDASYDFVHSSAVLEHVGSREQQLAFLRQLARVARHGVFFTTPNRWFPIEFHTVLPLLHWLPPSDFRRAVRTLGHETLADEQNLNLLGPGDVRTLCAALGPGFTCQVRTLRLFGWPSNIIGTIRRRRA
jgi:ubiquinone/menaquinone biosynthesis C-methylase UbiE